METRFSAVVNQVKNAVFIGALDPKNSINIDKFKGFFDKFILVNIDYRNRMISH